MHTRVPLKVLVCVCYVRTCERGADVFKRTSAAESLQQRCELGCSKQRSSGRRPAEKSSPAKLSLSSLMSTKYPNVWRLWPGDSQLAWQIWKQQTKSAESSWYCVKPLIAEKQHVRVLIDIHPEISPPCAVKPRSVLWLWRCRLVLLKSCLISRPWNGGCGKVWQQQIKGEW